MVGGDAQVVLGDAVRQFVAKQRQYIALEAEIRALAAQVEKDLEAAGFEVGSVVSSTRKS